MVLMIVFHKMTTTTFASNISREDERIDWTMNAKDIHNHIRGLSPWPVGYTTMDDTNLKLYAAHIVHKKGQPGKSSKRLKGNHCCDRLR